MPVGADEFREGLARWASGVTIVTARAGDRVHGMTVSAFSSVSLDPPLVLVCASKHSHTLDVIDAAESFAVNVLAQEQQALADRFASRDEEWRRFEGLALEPGRTGAPLLLGCLAVLDCRVVARHDAGDHVIYVGEVQMLEAREGQPLLFFRGRYQGLAEQGEDA